MILFLIDANLEKLELTSFSVKLTGLASQCWILALHLGLIERTPAHQFPSRFNLQSMNQMLEASGAKGDLRLSDKAKEFKQLFETFQKSQSGSAPIKWLVFTLRLNWASTNPSTRIPLKFTLGWLRITVRKYILFNVWDLKNVRNYIYNPPIPPAAPTISIYFNHQYQF